MLQQDLLKICLAPDQPISAAIACIDASGGEIALVVDGGGKLVGTVTDGDIRRGILRGLPLDAPASDLMNKTPRWAARSSPSAEIAARMRTEAVGQMPILDDTGVVVDVVFSSTFARFDVSRHTVVIMAGGLGTRLRPITETVPKPMIEVGGKPVLERIIARFREQGFRHVVLCVNHLAEIIEDYFGHGESFGVEIEYVRETKRMGTAGALSLLSRRPELPFIVMNGDILTEVNFGQMLSFHYEAGALATMGLNRFQYQIPYGVVDVHKHHITGFSEKPVFDFFVNAGIYVIAPETLDLLPKDRFYDMPSLFEHLAPDHRAAFPIHEYWLDIGRPDDLKRASEEHEARETD